MNTADSSYAEVSRKWRSTAKLLFGAEVGELKEYAEWLGSFRTLRSVRKSSLSGKDVVFSHSHWPNEGNFLLYSEIDFSKKYEPLDINKLKDIDSITEAVWERISYAGGLVLGNSHFIEKGSGIVDSNYLYNCDRCAHSKYMAHTTMGIYSENMFGVTGSGNSSFQVGGGCNMFINRCYEASKCDYVNDSYFVHGCSGCSDCMFSFSLRSKRFAIGNLVLPKEKYLGIKASLISELGEMLVRDKCLPTIISLVSSSEPDYAPLKKAMAAMPEQPSPKKDMRPLENSFSNTCKVVLGKPRTPIAKHEKWLLKNINKVEQCVSCASGAPVLLPEHTRFLSFPRGRLVTLREAFYLGEVLRISAGEAGGISMKNAAETVSKAAYFSPDWEMGNSSNLIDCAVGINSNSCYKCTLPINSKLCSSYYWPRDSEHLHGGNEVRSSSFCVSCFHSEKLTRCFEVDSSNNCSDCYFCHNCENVHDSMFCFNAKNLKNAVGNVQLPREKYLEVKARVLAEINSQLDKSCGVKQSIFSLAARKK